METKIKLTSRPEGKFLADSRKRLRDLSIKCLIGYLKLQYCNRIAIKDPNGNFNVRGFDHVEITEVNMAGLIGCSATTKKSMHFGWSIIDTDTLIDLAEYVGSI